MSPVVQVVVLAPGRPQQGLRVGWVLGLLGLLLLVRVPLARKQISRQVPSAQVQIVQQIRLIQRRLPTCRHRWVHSASEPQSLGKIIVCCGLSFLFLGKIWAQFGEVELRHREEGPLVVAAGNVHPVKDRGLVGEDAAGDGREGRQVGEELVVAIVTAHLLLVGHLLDICLKVLRQRIVLQEVFQEDL